MKRKIFALICLLVVIASTSFIFIGKDKNNTTSNLKEVKVADATLTSRTYNVL